MVENHEDEMALLLRGDNIGILCTTQIATNKASCCRNFDIVVVDTDTLEFHKD